MSVFKKVKTIFNTGIEPIERGMTNYSLNIPEIEETARERAKTCESCINFVIEPIDFLRKEDKRIKELSGKMCDICGCTMVYLLRQDLKICKYWKK